MKNRVFLLFIFLTTYSVFGQDHIRKVEVGFDDTNTNLYAQIVLQPDFMNTYTNCIKHIDQKAGSTLYITRLSFIEKDGEVLAILDQHGRPYFDSLSNCSQKVIDESIKCKVKVISFPNELITINDTLAISFFMLKLY
ncbi:hypothetical protein [Flammeovirga aprica]|uniref:Uncharacterized protein n=1 Tax=Flammeovirga aprica JL-4 TaxID=694437 RepID=A0A7X9XA58_9BACT|nr:hypothetical protein [Flammeovirga aprica]NME69299.1 hypothetical protein [Flammeovirga aprica JL-4]